jgi:hypothetical protein
VGADLARIVENVTSARGYGEPSGKPRCSRGQPQPAEVVFDLRTTEAETLHRDRSMRSNIF